MLVQRKWMYLEGIFIGGDIRSQLPEEAKKFDQIDKTFRRVSLCTFFQHHISMIAISIDSSCTGFNSSGGLQPAIWKKLGIVRTKYKYKFGLVERGLQIVQGR